jgi:hypothetical protein
VWVCGCVGVWVCVCGVCVCVCVWGGGGGLVWGVGSGGWDSVPARFNTRWRVALRRFTSNQIARRIKWSAPSTPWSFHRMYVSVVAVLEHDSVRCVGVYLLMCACL